LILQDPSLDNLFNELSEQEKEELKYGVLLALGFDDE